MMIPGTIRSNKDDVAILQPTGAYSKHVDFRIESGALFGLTLDLGLLKISLGGLFPISSHCGGL